MGDPHELPEIELPVDHPHVWGDGEIGHPDVVVPNPARWIHMIEFAAFAKLALPEGLAPDDIDESVDRTARNAREAYREGMTNREWVDATAELMLDDGYPTERREPPRPISSAGLDDLLKRRPEGDGE